MTATEETRRYSILITDDDRQCRETLQAIVAAEGFHTLLAESGEEALEIVREERVHLALLDNQLPRLTGLETLKLVHQINAVLPGWIDTDLTKRAREQVDGLQDTVEKRTPQGRWGTPDDMAGIGAFLASKASDFVTGTAIPVDAGMAIRW